MSGPATMKLPEMPRAQMHSVPDILTEILWRMDPPGIHGFKVREERVQEIVKIHLSSQAEIMRLEAQIKSIQAAACENAVKLL